MPREKKLGETGMAIDTMTAGAPKTSSFKRLGTMREAGLIAIILALCVIMTFASPHFLTLGNFRAMLMSFSVAGIVVVGMTILLIVGGIDLAVGSVVCFAMVLSGSLFLAGGRKFRHTLLGQPGPCALTGRIPYIEENGTVEMDKDFPARDLGQGRLIVSVDEILDETVHGLCFPVGLHRLGCLPRASRRPLPAGRRSGCLRSRHLARRSRSAPRPSGAAHLPRRPTGPAARRGRPRRCSALRLRRTHPRQRRPGPRRPSSWAASCLRLRRPRPCLPRRPG